jgi:GDP-4-dehydro-6-deoxy-D-mannose reductase
MAKILVTGINGFVGQHLAHELHDSGHVVIGIGGPQGSAEQSAYISTYLKLDLTKKEDAEKIDFKGVDYVIHLAGLAAVGPSFDSPMLYITTNIGIETNLYETALAKKIFPRFLIISSGSLYDPKAGLPLTEESTVLPSSPYAVSKLGQEHMGQYYAQRGFESIIARPFNHIGPGQSPGFIVPDLAKQIIDNEQGKSDKVLVGNMDSQRDYTDVRDIARAYRLLLEKGRPGAVYNICSGTSRSGQELLDGLLKQSDKKPAIEQDPDKMRPVQGADIIYGSHQKLSNDTGWEPIISIEKTLSDVMYDWRNRTKQ